MMASSKSLVRKKTVPWRKSRNSHQQRLIFEYAFSEAFGFVG